MSWRISMIEISNFEIWMYSAGLVVSTLGMIYYAVLSRKAISELVDANGHIKRLEDEMRLECAMIYDDAPTLEEEVDLEGLELQARKFGVVEPGCK